MKIENNSLKTIFLSTNIVTNIDLSDDIYNLSDDIYNLSSQISTNTNDIYYLSSQISAGSDFKKIKLTEKLILNSSFYSSCVSKDKKQVVIGNYLNNDLYVFDTSDLIYEKANFYAELSTADGNVWRYNVDQATNVFPLVRIPNSTNENSRIAHISIGKTYPEGGTASKDMYVATVFGSPSKHIAISYDLKNWLYVNIPGLTEEIALGNSMVCYEYSTKKYVWAMATGWTTGKIVATLDFKKWFELDITKLNPHPGHTYVSKINGVKKLIVTSRYSGAVTQVSISVDSNNNITMAAADVLTIADDLRNVDAHGGMSQDSTTQTIIVQYYNTKNNGIYRLYIDQDPTSSTYQSLAYQKVQVFDPNALMLSSSKLSSNVEVIDGQNVVKVPVIRCNGMSKSNGKLFMVLYGFHVIMSEDDGKTWNIICDAKSDSGYIGFTTFQVGNSIYFAGQYSRSGRIYKLIEETTDGITKYSLERQSIYNKSLIMDSLISNLTEK